MPEVHRSAETAGQATAVRPVVAPEGGARERLSAWMDGELAGPGAAGCLADACRGGARHADWVAWHCAGDAMRSAEVGALHSDAFCARMAQALAAEPTLLAPAVAADGRARRTRLLRLVLPGSAVAAAGAVVVFLAVPQWRGDAGQQLAGGAGGVAPASVTATRSAAEPAAPAADGAGTVEVVRLPQLEAYLAAHREAGGAPALLPRATTYLRTSVATAERR